MQWTSELCVSALLVRILFLPLSHSLISQRYNAESCKTKTILTISQLTQLYSQDHALIYDFCVQIGLKLYSKAWSVQ